LQDPYREICRKIRRKLFGIDDDEKEKDKKKKLAASLIDKPTAAKSFSATTRNIIDM